MAAACAIAFGLVRTAFYFAPNWEQEAYAAIKSVPGAQYVVRPSDAKMLALAKRGQIQPMDVSAEDQGISVHVVGAYADGLRTVLFLRIDADRAQMDGSGSLVPGPGVVLTDQFGQRYIERGMTWNLDTHAGNLEFDGVAPWKLALGVRFTLHIPVLERAPEAVSNAGATSSDFQDVGGSWNLNWVQTSIGSTRSISLDSTAASNGVEIRLTRVTLSPSAMQFTLTASGDFQASPPASPSGTGLGEGKSSAGTGPSEERAFYLERATTGERLPLATWWGSMSYGREVTWQLVTSPVTQPGKYVLVITRFNGQEGRWELPFTIPSG
ncbi:DUF4179 domain-containing protein [Alicyclobacillus cellulosilyticus]|uniref:DUF4179 domain-containing protein n=1 Tax=Alicyclobacillus cellulosilyticus TaxID=1003997 RepID=UPI001662D592|nr:DUF4179 domain-containing protein [Alicyclobacillus cellulosilyticus]